MQDTTSAAGAPLEQAIAAIESRLAALSAAIGERDAAAVEASAVALQRALAITAQRFDHGGRALLAASPDLRRRLAGIAATVGAQRETLARASAGVDRSLAVLLPTTRPAAGYAASGSLDHLSRGDYVGA